MARGFSRGPRMRKHWIGMFGGTQSHTASGTKIQNTPLEPNDAFTILRMLGGYTIFPGAAPAAQDQATIGCGIAVVSADAATLGATAVPDPIADPAFPWLFWQMHGLHFGTTSLDPNGTGFVRHMFDIRSMRKIKPSEALVFVTEYADGVGTPPIKVDVQVTRILVAH